MNSDIIDALLIGWASAVLFLFGDKYERDRPMASLLRFSVLFVGGVAILHKLQPMFGFALF